MIQSKMSSCLTFFWYALQRINSYNMSEIGRLLSLRQKKDRIKAKEAIKIYSTVVFFFFIYCKKITLIYLSVLSVSIYEMHVSRLTASSAKSEQEQQKQKQNQNGKPSNSCMKKM